MVTKRAAIDFGIEMARAFPKMEETDLLNICEKLTVQSARARKIQWHYQSTKFSKEEVELEIERLMKNLDKINSMIVKCANEKCAPGLSANLRSPNINALEVHTRGMIIPVPSWST